jgi:hypothetical protein
MNLTVTDINQIIASMHKVAKENESKSPPKPILERSKHITILDIEFNNSNVIPELIGPTLSSDNDFTDRRMKRQPTIRYEQVYTYIQDEYPALHHSNSICYEITTIDVTDLSGNNILQICSDENIAEHTDNLSTTLSKSMISDDVAAPVDDISTAQALLCPSVNPSKKRKHLWYLPGLKVRVLNSPSQL